MPIPVIMPNLGMTSEESTLVRWLVREGDPVTKGQPMFEAESDKATVEGEAPEAGIVSQLIARPGDSITAGTVIAVLAASGVQSANETSAVSAAPTGRRVASPLARRIAAQHHVDLHRLRGTGPGGRIIAADVTDALALTQPLATAPVERVQPSPVSEKPQPIEVIGPRAVIARRMVESARATVPVTLTTEIDAGALVNLRQTLQSEAGELASAISYDLIAAVIAAHALRQHPQLNTSLTADGIQQHQQVHVGVAVDAPHGLFVAVLRDVNERKVLDLARDLDARVTRIRQGSARLDDLTGSTFTITNLGMAGVDAFTPVINLPECAILGLGRIRSQAMVRGDQVVAGQTMWLSLTFDHRLVDGGPAARFLQTVARLMQQPALLWLR